MAWSFLSLAFWGLVICASALSTDRDLCPETCMVSGPNPSNWTVVANIRQLDACDRPMVLDFSVRELITNNQHIRACNVWANDFAPTAFLGLSSPPRAKSLNIKSHDVAPELAWNPATSERDYGGRLVTVSMDNLSSYLKNKPETANTTTLFATAVGATAGVYVGTNLLDANITRLFSPVYEILATNGLATSRSALIQVCNDSNPADTFGLVVAADSDFSTVHDVVGNWANGSCVDVSSYSEHKKLNKMSVLAHDDFIPEIESSGSSNTTHLLQARADCKTVSVIKDDLCGDLIKRCGIKATVIEFERLNPIKNFCNTLQEGQRVCCTSGTLPDIRPKKRADGSCFPYQIKLGEYCPLIAARYGLTVQELKAANKNTWGWNGCDYGFWTDNWICLSDGTPPFPASISNAVCGPQKPGTKMPSGSESKDWAKLNPCPLKSCCNTWGQCGTTADFCVDTNTGSPGTAKKDTFGCISNCGMSVVKGSPPANFIKLGYFEGFNLGRPCLNMDPSQIDSSFTHVHFAFAMLDNNFKVYHEDKLAEHQFQQFKKIRGPKRIISFGGWVFSAEAPNYQILRNAVLPENRERFTDNLVDYVVSNDLDGLDIDWEYPSAPDIPGIPPGDPREALDYLAVLTILRRKLPKGKSLSIAAPASYWYLKQFNIEAMSRSLDYIVFMTYDLHGQWDAGNKWASPGCPTGNCLRSHINMTETVNSLAMITKAGVPSNKVLVGVTSYGRSFQMANPSCTGPTCLFTGDRLVSNARKGRCTQTAGYISNAEIKEINGRTFMDGSQSMIMVDGDLWVSYMDDKLKASRTNTYKGLNMGGTIDWAIDLDKLYPPPSAAANLGIGWSAFKENIQSGRGGTCPDRDNPKGAFTKPDCSDDVLDGSRYPARTQWDAVAAQSLWDWILKVYKGCYPDDPEKRPTFDFIANGALGWSGKPECWKLSSTQCHEEKSCDTGKFQFAGGHLVWNAIVGVRGMLSEYYNNLEMVGAKLSSTKETFIGTFAPEGVSAGDIVELLSSFIQIPYGIGVTRILGSRLLEKYTPENSTSAKIVEGFASMGYEAASVALKEGADNREEIAFNEIYEVTIESWQNQTATLLSEIFNGKNGGTDLLDALVENGKMLDGWNGTKDGTTDTVEYLKDRVSELSHAFYSAGIPMLWKADKQGPVMADFGPSCEIDAREYFKAEPQRYNVGWECINGHSYILAGVRESNQPGCGIIGDSTGNDCPGTAEWLYDILKGISEVKKPNNEWQTSVRQIMEAALKTYRANGNKNVLDDPEKSRLELSASDPDFSGFINDKTINIAKVPGLVRIPVCSPQVAKAHLFAGIDWYKKKYGSTANWPC